MTTKIEERKYYILAGDSDKWMKKHFEESGLATDINHLMIIPHNSKIGKLIRKKHIREMKQK